jgi:hypothetical protein
MRLKLWILTPMIKIQLCLNTLKERRHKLWYHGGRHCVAPTATHKIVLGGVVTLQAVTMRQYQNRTRTILALFTILYIEVIQHERLEMFAVLIFSRWKLGYRDEIDDVTNHQVPLGCKVTKN